jgi:uncharacterized membrane protein (DUF2068 family)
MNASPRKSASERQHRNAWLLLIALFKLSEALLFIAIGIGARHLIQVDIDDFLSQVFTILRFDPESNFVNFVLEKASILDEHMLRRISAVVFAYAAICLIESIGLYLEKAWAEYATVLITASFLPLEIYEFARRSTWPRACLLVLNALVLLYLLKLIVDRARGKMQTKMA